jgi:hypothetical protein
MKNKTTLQKLVEAIKKREVEVYYTTTEGIVISRLDEFLEMEKNELIKAHSEGIRFMSEDSTIPQLVSIDWFLSNYDAP